MVSFSLLDKLIWAKKYGFDAIVDLEIDGCGHLEMDVPRASTPESHSYRPLLCSHMQS